MGVRALPALYGSYAHVAHTLQLVVKVIDKHEATAKLIQKSTKVYS